MGGQLYAYLLPAFSSHERRAILPLLLLIPVLFIAGIVFGYFVVLPAATTFLLNFNDAQFNIQGSEQRTTTASSQARQPNATPLAEPAVHKPCVAVLSPGASGLDSSVLG